MPHPIRPLAVLSLLAALAAPVSDANATPTPVPAPVAYKASAPRGGMCTGPQRCPKGYYYVGPPTCSCVPKPKP
jgi:hypothetical protein